MAQMFVGNVYKSLFWGALVTYLMVILLDLKTFQMWPQVQTLYEAGFPVNLKSIYLHPHGLRYTLVYPIYLMAELLQVSPDIILSLAVLAMCVMISHSLSHCIALHRKSTNIWKVKFFVFLFFAALTLFMNGRLIYGLCAYSLMIYGLFLFVKDKDATIKKQVLAACLISLAILFSSSSSGVAISFYAISVSSICIYLLYAFRQKIRINYPVMISMFIFFLLYTPIILFLINKNLAFFGGGFDGFLLMAQHGMLNGMDDYLVFKVLCCGFTALLACFVYFYRNSLTRDPLLFFTAYCMALMILLSLFAFSILMMAFIPAILMSAFLLSRFSILGKHFFERYHTSTHGIGSK